MNADLYFFREFLFVFCRDDKIGVWHIAIFFAFVQLADRGLQTPIYISRSLVMRLSRIRSIVTYHKLMKELQALGYIRYIPSYHPGKRSMIYLLRPQLKNKPQKDAEG